MFQFNPHTTYIYLFKKSVGLVLFQSSKYGVNVKQVCAQHLHGGFQGREKDKWFEGAEKRSLEWRWSGWLRIH